MNFSSTTKTIVMGIGTVGCMGTTAGSLTLMFMKLVSPIICVPSCITLSLAFSCLAITAEESRKKGRDEVTAPRAVTMSNEASDIESEHGAVDNHGPDHEAENGDNESENGDNESDHGDQRLLNPLAQ